MARRVIALGPDAIRRAVAILAAGEIGEPQGGPLASGDWWGGDRMLLSVNGDSVRFVAGSTLYEQDHVGFLLQEFPAGSAPPRRTFWLRGLSTYETPLFLALAGELVRHWPGTGTACGFLDRYGHFYCSYRPRIERAARELRTVAEGLLALQHWPALFDLVMDSMGHATPGILPKGTADADLGAFLGRMIMGAQAGQITLDRVPAAVRALRDPPVPQAEECLRIPHYRRMLEKVERGAASAALLIEQLRGG